MPFLGTENFGTHLLKLLSPFSLEHAAMIHYNHHKIIKLHVAIFSSTYRN